MHLIREGVLVAAVAAAAMFAVPGAAQEALPANLPSQLVPDDAAGTEAVALGKQLYFDPRLSKTGTVSCNSCHNLMEGGDDSRPTSTGVHGQTGARNAPTVWNAAFLSVQFWDGRAESLEAQAKGPLVNPIEMGMESHDVVIERIKRLPGYVAQFERVFDGKDSLHIDNVARAIAAFERTLLTPNAPFDQYLAGKKRAISKTARKGYKLFQSAGCVACHSGPALAGPVMPVGKGFYQKFPTFADNEYVKRYDLDDDLGRYAVTQKDADKHMFRVPTLRNVALTAPYFHNGSVPTLAEAVKVMAKTQLNRDLDETEVAELVAFLETLTGEFPELTLPRLPEAGGASVVR